MSRDKTLRIDILMATYNGEKYLAEQLDSILAQTYENWRLLVSDDCSSDRTLDILHDYAKRDSRIRVVSEDIRYGGPKENFWALLGRADAPYMMFCDQDDVWHDDKIEVSLACMKKLEDEHGLNSPLLIFTDLRVVDESLRVLSDSFMRLEHYYSIETTFDNMLLRNVAPGCTMLFNRNLKDKALVPAQLDFIDMHDWWLMIVAALMGHIAYIDRSTIDYRQHENNVLGATQAGKTEERFVGVPSIAHARRKARRLCKRAAAVIECYGELLDQHQRDRLIAVSQIASGGIKGVRALVASGFWDNTKQRRAGQLVAAFLPG